MPEYHKIQTMFKRNMEAPGRPLIEGHWTLGEFEYLALNRWQLTEKVAGQNIRLEWDGRISFFGKTDKALIPAPLYARLMDRFYPQIVTFERRFPTGATLYFEGYGPGIENGGKYRSDQDIVLLDVKVGEWWLRRSSLEDVANRFSLPIVPIIHTGNDTLLDAIELVKNGFQSRWGAFEAEGLVAKPMMELRTRGGDRIITKIKAQDFRIGVPIIRRDALEMSRKTLEDAEMERSALFRVKSEFQYSAASCPIPGGKAEHKCGDSFICGLCTSGFGG